MTTLTEDDLLRLLPYAPQDPFLPIEPSLGPIFLDTGACLCALRNLPPPAVSGRQKWHCIGNQTMGVYNSTEGKWFDTTIGQRGDSDNLPLYDASRAPVVNEAFIWDKGKKDLVKATDDKLTIYERACTALNDTLFSTARYSAELALGQDKVPVDAVPCYREGAVPMQMQNVSSWQQTGCLPGFLCRNNTINSLPQYCPPVTECQQLRLGGKVCAINDRNIAMGPFEPVLCQEGNYCPPPGVTSLPCPKGSYCQPGAATPTPCATGSYCPEGSVFGLLLIPLAVLIAFDLIMVVLLIFSRIRKQRRIRAKGAALALEADNKKTQLKRTKTLNMVRRLGGYSEITDEQEYFFGGDDHEMGPMGPTYMPSRGDHYGFEAALGVEGMQNWHDKSAAELEKLSPELKTFLESMRRATDASRFGLSFAYSGLTFHPKSAPRPILQNITGSIERGSLVAVMGGSGAGKSTFVNVLMGKTNNTGGTVMVNNVPGKIERYKKLIGYVPQDDIVLPELTVFENILHSARIRLPRTWADKDIIAHVESVVVCLELAHVRDSLVGSIGKPVISGGQRKRVSIGMELAAAPMAIFLDEPTSGLDAAAASSIMKTLKAIARLGISVITIIHQPRLEIFEALDDLILLGNGQTIYEGKEDEAQAYFERMGFRFPPHSNTGDIITDIITGNGRAYKSSGDVSKESLIGHWAKHRESAAQNPRASTLSLHVPDQHMLRQVLKRRGARRHRQLLLCLSRAMLQQRRGLSSVAFEMALASIAGVLLGLAEQGKRGIMFVGFYHDPYQILSTAVDIKSAPEVALLTCIAIGLVCSAPGVRVFSEEMLLQRRETEAGHSQVSYFLAKVVSVLPRIFLGCFHFTTLFFLLSKPTISWPAAFVANLCYFYCIYGLASVVSMISRREDAPLLATMLSLIVGLLSGASPPLATVKTWHLEWLWRASPGVWLANFYFFQLLMPLEYLYDVDMASAVTGYPLDWQWRNVMYLVIIGTLYRVLAYIGLLIGQRMRI